MKFRAYFEKLKTNKTINRSTVNSLKFIFSCNTLEDITAFGSVIRLCVLNLSIMAIVIPLGVWGEYEDPGRWFREGRLMTWISVFQLLAIGWFAKQIWLKRGKGEAFCWKKPVAVWRVMSVGFSFLALDELCRIHETLDRYTHKIFSITETAITDRADDLLILLYGIIGLLVLFHYRSEFLKYRKSFWYFFCAFILSLISISLDVLTNREDLIAMLITNTERARQVFLWAATAEDVLKILAEVFFLGAFIRCFTLTRDEDCLQ